MDATVWKYFSSCKVCHPIKAPRHTRHGVNIPLLPPYRPWEGVTIDFITDQALSTASGCTRILVGVDWLTKITIFLPCREDIHWPELPWLFFEHMIWWRGVPHNIITSCGTQFTSQFWTRVSSFISVDHHLSTSFHPQSDGQTDHQNHPMEQYLRVFCNY